MGLKFKVGSKYETAMRRLAKRGFKHVYVESPPPYSYTEHVYEGKYGERKVIRTDPKGKKVLKVYT